LQNPGSKPTEPSSATPSEVALPGEAQRPATGIRPENVIYPIAILCSILNWFFALRSPLWLDETVSYWQITAGFSQLWARQGISFVAYPFLLLVTKSLFGSSIYALRMPSILAMLAAVYFLYRIARQLFDVDVAGFVTVIFCLYPPLMFAAIDARPYAFAVLAVTVAIDRMLRWTRSGSTRDAVWFGISAALILYFHFLFGIVVAAFAIYLLMVARQRPDSFHPDWKAALIPFCVVLLPVVPLILKIVTTTGEHVFYQRATLSDLAGSFATDYLRALFMLAALIAAAMSRVRAPRPAHEGTRTLPLLLAFVPLLAFFVLSAATPIHMFVSRYYLVAVPGIALCWGLMVSCFDSRWLRAALCLSVVVAMTAVDYDPGFSTPHGYTWKYALEVAETNTAVDHAPLLICSDIPESDRLTSPFDSQSGMLAPLSYYKVSSPVVGLPRSVTPLAQREIDQFLQQMTARRQRFLVVAYEPSWATIRYLVGVTDKTYTHHPIGVYDRVGLVEFSPRPSAP